MGMGIRFRPEMIGLQTSDWHDGLLSKLSLLNANQEPRTLGV